MPTTTRTSIDQFDIDTAMLPHQQIADDSLDTISNLIDGIDSATEMIAHLEHMKQMLMTGSNAYMTREQFAVDLDQLADRIHIAVGNLLA